jgi:hypothetical protein
LPIQPAKGFKTTAPGPGRASWSWPLLGDDNTIVKVQKRFIDYAAEMNWQYNAGGLGLGPADRLRRPERAGRVGRAKNVKILVWYNSAGEWNTTPLTPRDLMFDPRRGAPNCRRSRTSASPV